MRTKRKIWAVAAGISGLAMIVTACSSNGGTTSPTTAGGGSSSAAATTAATASVCPDGTPTVTVSTFNNFGYQPPTDKAPGADLWAKYKTVCPNVTVKETVAASSDDARAAFNTAISTGTGAYDIQAVDIDWMPSIMAQPDKFVDLTKYKTSDNDWLDWKVQQATTPDGKLLGFGTDIGPEGICYRSDLLAAAGMPSDRDAVAALLGGKDATWDKYFAVGKQYVDKTGKAWFDSAAATYQGMVNQIQYSYIDKSDTVIATTNPDIKTAYDQLTAAAVGDKESAGLKQWGDDWNAAFKSDKFATMLCPAWIVNNIKGNAGADFKGWDIADVFPAAAATGAARSSSSRRSPRSPRLRPRSPRG
ncbi:MAG TPA: carbohydrate ABC transporter substrate-binding protein [Cellulomonas sp.]